jgi:hypothetical protein
MPELPLDLTLEQQFQFAALSMEAETLSLEDARSLLLSMIKQKMIQDNVVKTLMKSVIAGSPCC